MNSTDLDGKVAIVTGAGDGLGRAEALALAKAGARVVVNDVSAGGVSRADDVVSEIRDAGGEAVSHVADVGEWSTGDDLIKKAESAFGQLDILVNNAGILREKMLFNMTEDEWDAVLRVHLRGHFIMLRAATHYWRDRSKKKEAPIYGRIINTSSEAYLNGSPGQPNYAAAKAGIVALTLAADGGCAKYGVNANAICPRARTAMTEDIFSPKPEDTFDPMSVEHVAPFVAFLASPASEQIRGQVFIVYAGRVALLSPPTIDEVFTSSDTLWTPTDLNASVGAYFDGREPSRNYAAGDFSAELGL